MITIDRSKCLCCGACVGVCPSQALTLVGTAYIECEGKKCTECGTCARICPAGAISMPKKKGK